MSLLARNQACPTGIRRTASNSERGKQPPPCHKASLAGVHQCMIKLQVLGQAFEALWAAARSQRGVLTCPAWLAVGIHPGMHPAAAAAGDAHPELAAVLLRLQGPVIELAPRQTMH